MTEKTNTFKEMEEQRDAPHTAPATTRGEVAVADFSDTAVGDTVKYVRPDLKGTIDTVDRFQVFEADTSKEPSTTQSGNAHYWSPEIVLYWSSQNDDGVQNKEYVSGAKQWQQKDGSASPINFWYAGGADNENQCAMLWETVAKCLNVESNALSPRQFVAFLNSKPKFKVVGQKTKNYLAKAGSPTHIYKNMPGEHVKA